MTTKRPAPSDALDALLTSQGYKLVDDAWEAHGRRTYLHDDDATRGYTASIAKVLAPLGWSRDRNKMREFRHEATGEIVELEPGGAEANGHFLHYINEG